MIIPIKCYTCGNVLGSKINRFHQLMNHDNLLLKNNKIYLPSEISSSSQTKTITKSEKKKILTEFIKGDGEQKPIESLILNKIGLKRYCCRKIIISHIETV